MSEQIYGLWLLPLSLWLWWSWEVLQEAENREETVDAAVTSAIGIVGLLLTRYLP